MGNTAPNGGGGMIRAFGESVGQTIMARFVNALPSKMRGWYSQPSGIVHATCGSQQEILLSGTEGLCPSPSPSPSASPTLLPSPTGLPSPSSLPSPIPTPIPSPSPVPSPSIKPSP
ncbi:MAG: hypothetical protein E6J40_04940 [Chloroflexi bacterium]|nr:MAG: hypothetical protein E6J40_04940 [Chloroflexota bacterium]